MAGAVPSAAGVLALVPPSLRGREGLWVVGGAVRDVLLGRGVRELDLVVEGDAVAVAREVGEVLAVHERFGTATARVDGVVVDLAGARRERYARPGALPEVELGAGIEDDLRRRDFTVNAMAVRVADGREVAVAGARRDLDARVLRVLHDKSFADDPTRLLRMARYAARLGFSAEAGTARLAAVAVAAGAPATVTGARLGNELLLLLGEPQPEAALALAAHGVGAALLGVPYAPDEAAVARAVALCPPGAHRGIAALATAIASSGGRWADLSSDGDEYPAHGDREGGREGRWADLSSDGDEYPAHGEREGGRLAERLAALALPARERDLVVRAATEAPALAPWLAEPRRPSALWDRLRRAPAEVVTVAGGLEPRATESARRWLEDIRHVRAEITGSDLLERGIAGPAVGRGLDAALRARLDGEAPDRERQLAVALAAAG